MNEAFKAVLYQAFGYSFAMILGIGILAVLMRGFLFKFIRVKASLGKKALIRIKKISHWEYAVGAWDEGDLVFGDKKSRKRINKIDSSDIYRSLGINWVDLNGKTWEIIPPAVSDAKNAFDPEKQESLVTRALYKPPIEDVQKKVMLLLIILAIVAGAASAYFGYNILNEVGFLRMEFQAFKNGMVVATG